MTIATEEKLSGYVFNKRDFSGADLKEKCLKGSIFHDCNFDGADLSFADCSGCDFLGSTFRKTKCYKTNFKDSKLAATVFEPEDCFGMTITLQCSTFKNMRVSQLWWYGWLVFLSYMIPVSKSVEEEESIKSILVSAMGVERYVRLRAMFQRREF